MALLRPSNLCSLFISLVTTPLSCLASFLAMSNSFWALVAIAALLFVLANPHLANLDHALQGLNPSSEVYDPPGAAAWDVSSQWSYRASSVSGTSTWSSTRWSSGWSSAWWSSGRSAVEQTSSRGSIPDT